MRELKSTNKALLKFGILCLSTLFVGVLLVTLTAISLSKQTQASESDNKEHVVLLHGLGRGASSMWMLDKRLTHAGYVVHRLEYDSLSKDPGQIVTHIEQQINRCCVSGAKTVHFVGHSLGGLVIRAYLQKETPVKLGRVVLLGTPNQGTAVVDNFRDYEWFDLLGPTTLALGTDEHSFPHNLPLPHYPVGVIAGYKTLDFNDWYLPGEDDGLVAVEATKIANMTDFIAMNVGHGMMRYQNAVAQQVITFLQQGMFDKQRIENK